MTAETPELVAISALQHWSYCPRQCALIHVEQVFADNLHTARGNAVHALVDEPGAAREGTIRTERAMPLWNDQLGLIGKADLVEFARDGSAYPVEYKHGPKRQRAHDDLQLAAQALCLEEMTGKPVPFGAIFHFSSRRRREVAITSRLREDVASAARAVRSLLQSTRLPAPAHDARCRQCSLIDLCQPAAVAAQTRYRRLLSDLYDPQ
ncbi:MAG: CRISPR-associated protein Cas4 [Xanthomonadaceae bacterium]|nr:CRISPR-associated protein Cas4 [Xanthomonadaceae bacterium]